MVKKISKSLMVMSMQLTAITFVQGCNATTASNLDSKVHNSKVTDASAPSSLFMSEFKKLKGALRVKSLHTESFKNIDPSKLGVDGALPSIRISTEDASTVRLTIDQCITTYRQTSPDEILEDNSQCQKEPRVLELRTLKISKDGSRFIAVQNAPAQYSGMDGTGVSREGLASNLTKSMASLWELVSDTGGMDSKKAESQVLKALDSEMMGSIIIDGNTIEFKSRFIKGSGALQFEGKEQFVSETFSK